MSNIAQEIEDVLVSWLQNAGSFNWVNNVYMLLDVHSFKFLDSHLLLQVECSIGGLRVRQKAATFHCSPEYQMILLTASTFSSCKAPLFGIHWSFTVSLTYAPFCKNFLFMLIYGLYFTRTNSTACNNLLTISELSRTILKTLHKPIREATLPTKLI